VRATGSAIKNKEGAGVSPAPSSALSTLAARNRARGEHMTTQQKRPFLVNLTDEYYHAIKAVDSRVLYNKPEAHKRPYLGVVITVNKRLYCLPFTSPKPMRTNWTERVGYLPIRNNQYGSLMIVDMVPVAATGAVIQHVDIATEKEKDSKYAAILVNQTDWLESGDNLNRAVINANKLYSYYQSNTLNDRLQKLTLPFSQLENCLEQYLHERGLDTALAFANKTLTP
jgi:hypothetical protein